MRGCPDDAHKKVSGGPRLRWSGGPAKRDLLVIGGEEEKDPRLGGGRAGLCAEVRLPKWRLDLRGKKTSKGGINDHKGEKGGVR